MEATGPTATLRLELVDKRLVDEDLDALTGNLRRELLESEVVSVERVRVGEIPSGARSGEVASLAALIVTTGTTTAALTSTVNAVRGWLGRDGNRKVVVELDGDKLEISGSSDEDQRRLISLWVERHGSA